MVKQADERARRVQEILAQSSAALNKGDAARAMLLVRQALALQPREASCHLLVAGIYQHMGKDVLAQRAMATARSLDATAATVVATGHEPDECSEFDPPPGQQLLDAGQRRLLLDGVLHYLSRLTAAEQVMQQVGLGNSQEVAVFHEICQQLRGQAHEARAAWRSETRPAAPATPSAAPRIITSAYHAIPAFTRPLGNMPGAVNQGLEIESLQKLLNLEGIGVPVSGRYDQSTSLGVSKLQAQHGLKQRDGVVNLETRNLLNRLTGHRGSGLIEAKPKQLNICISQDTQAAFNRLLQQQD